MSGWNTKLLSYDFIEESGFTKTKEKYRFTIINIVV